MSGDPSFPRRILVVGVTGSGKTTMARAIAERLGLRHIETDEHFWGPSWTQRGDEEFRNRVRSAASEGGWVACGNYHGRLKDVTWSSAEMIVWLDLPRRVTLSRLLRRTLRRVLTREVLWSGNKEGIRNTLFSRESLLVWWWKVTRAEPQRTLERLQDARQAIVVRLRSKREADAWLQSLGSTKGILS